MSLHVRIIIITQQSSTITHHLTQCLAHHRHSSLVHATIAHTQLNTMSVTVNERLSESVRKYVVLYDKSHKDFKDKTVVENAWKAVVSECGANDAPTEER